MSDFTGSSFHGRARADEVEPAMKRAMQALRVGRPDMAERILLEVLEINPNHINAIKMLAECAIVRSDYERASHLFERCLELAPKFDAARFRYVSMLYLQNRLKETLPHIDILLARDPQNPRFRAMKASIAGQMGDSEQSLALLAALTDEYPNDGPCWISYGHALKTVGKVDESVTAYRKAVALLPQPGDGYWGLANLKTFHFASSDISEMKRHLARDDLRTETRVQLLFSLGKAHEDQQEYRSAFECYRDGNALWRSAIVYDPNETHAFVQSSKRVLTTDFFKMRHGFGHKARDPIFIVGMPRAGSTLIEQILSSHSQIEGTMELPNIPTLASALNGTGEGAQYPDVLASLDIDGYERLGRQYVESTAAQRRTGRHFFIDKMPHNYAHIALIHLMLPNAKIIDARRHPMGCGFSNYRQFFESGQHFTFSLEDIGRYYRDYVELMAHWDTVLPGKVHRVIYESVVESPEAEIRRILDFLELPFEKECLRFYETERKVRTSSSEQVRRPLYKSAVDQWKHFEPWLGPLKTALGPVADRYPGTPEF